MRTDRYVGGHSVTLLTGGQAFFPDLVGALDTATQEIYLETYIFDFRGAGIEVASALVHAARRGVQVYVSVDGVGTGLLPADWQARFDDAGVQWQVYAPLGRLGLLIPGHWRRLHRKLCVVDRRVAYCGGINVLDDRLDPTYGVLDAPRFDLALRVQGPLVLDVLSACQQLWRRSRTVQQLRSRDLVGAWQTLRAPHWTQEDPGYGGGEASGAHGRAVPPDQGRVWTIHGVLAKLVLRDNLGRRRDIERAYLKAMGEARAEIVLAHAYFLPGRKIRRALLAARARGVAVTVLLQGRYEYFLQYHASRAVYADLLKAGINIVEYGASFLHAKVGVVDAGLPSAWVTVGSSNFDPLSLLLAREANVVVHNAALAQVLHDHLQAVIRTDGTSVSLTAFAQRTWRERWKDQLAWAILRATLFLSGRRY
jgi:cardiolipin synthase A/B